MSSQQDKTPDIETAKKWLEKAYDKAPEGLKPAIYPLYFLTLLSLFYAIVMVCFYGYREVVEQVKFAWTLSMFLVAVISIGFPFLDFVKQFKHPTLVQPSEKEKIKEKQTNQLQGLNKILGLFVFDLNQTKLKKTFMPEKNPFGKNFLEVLPEGSRKILEEISELKNDLPEIFYEAKQLAGEAIVIKNYWYSGKGPDLMTGNIIPNYIKKLEKLQEKISTIL